MTKRDFELKSDGLGLGLFAFGVFCAVLVVQAMLKGVDPEPGQFVKLVAALWVNSIGAFPSLVFNAAMAALGARLFLSGAMAGLVRHLVGAGFLAASLSILCGAFGGSAGGAFGARTGGVLSDLTHVALAALVGALCCIATVWFVWARREQLPGEESPRVRNPDLHAPAPAAEDEGVSHAEAEALLPIQMTHVAAEERKTIPTPPPSPYPEDVRRKGEIPAGTRPIGTTHASSTVPAAGFPPSVYRWTAPGARHEPQRAGADLAPAGAAAAAARAGFEPSEDGAAAGDRFALADEELSTPQARGAAAVAGSQKAGALPRPAWEAGDEDPPVDAYGTPLALVESLRKQAGAGAPVEQHSEARPLVPAREDDDQDDALLDELSDEEPLAAATGVMDDRSDVDEDTPEDEPFDDEEQPPGDEEPLDEDDLDEALEEALRPAARVGLDEEPEEPDEAEETAVDGRPAATRATLASFDDGELDDDDVLASLEAAARGAPSSETYVTETDEAFDELEAGEDTALATSTDEDELARAVRALEDEASVEGPEAGSTAQAELPEFGAVVQPADVGEPEPLSIASVDASVAETIPAAQRRRGERTTLAAEAALDELAVTGAPAPNERVPQATSTEEGAAGESPATLFGAEPLRTTEGAAPASAAFDAEPEEHGEAHRKAGRALSPSLFDASEIDEPASSVFQSEPGAAPERKPARRRAAAARALEPAGEASSEAGGEREVVLTPPAVAAERTHKTPNGTRAGERTALLAEVGCLFIDRGRVAVSMLQRQYNMEFDDACKVLDELQGMGLIGPYLGGQRRDILLSREAWLEKVGSG